MKYSIIVLMFYAFALLLSSCTNRYPQAPIERTDTLSVEFSEYMITNGPFKLHKQLLIKYLTKDSTIYNYYDSLGSTLLNSYILHNKPNQLELTVAYPKGDWATSLGLVANYHAFDSLQFLKFQILVPQFDGDGAIVVSPELGVVGTYSYSWGINNILTKWGEQKVASQILDILRNDKFSRNTEVPKENLNN